MIARALCTQFLQRKCIVLVPNTTWAGNEADVLGVTMDLRLIDIEIKISRSDLKADAGKMKWWRSEQYLWGDAHGPARPRMPREWPRKVWKHYYALPADLWKPELLACLPTPRSGVLLLKQGRGFDSVGNPLLDVHCERRSQPCKDADKLTAEQALDVARLANLRMWDAYGRLHKREPAEVAT